jgi:integrase
MEIVSDQPIVYQAIFYFAVLCGLRRGEIIGLKWDDLDFDRLIFYIKRSATRQKGTGTYTDKPKNKKSERKLNLPETLIPFLKVIRAEQSRQKLRLGDKWIDEGYIFTTWNGKIMGVDAPDQWLSRMKEKYDKFPKKDLHTLRHTFATDMILSNVPLSTVSGALGHAQQSTTVNIYSHVMEDSKTSAMKSHEDAIMKLKNKSVQ